MRISAKLLAWATVPLLGTGGAQAALLESAGPSATLAFDSTLSTAALIYDADYFGPNEGRLVLLATGSSLKGPGVPSGAGTPIQLYLGTGDSLRDLVVEIRIDNRTGAFISGAVTLPKDNAAAGTADSWSYSGSLTHFGFADYAGGSANTFDARWGVDAYDFGDVAADPGLVGAPAVCATGNGRCGMGYLRFSTAAIPYTAATAGAPVDFSVDWVRGAGLSGPNVQLGAYDDNIAAGAFAAQSVTADVFVTPVPLPAALPLFGLGLGLLVPVARRHRRA